MFEIFPKLWTIVYEAKPIEQLGVALSLLPILVSWVLWLRARIGARSAQEQLANANDRIKILEQNRDEAIAARKAAEADRDALSPDYWLRVADKEQAQGNEEKAMAVLADGFAGVRSGMAHTTLALAGYHLSQIIGPDRAFHLDEGERFARMATLLDPGDADAAALAEEAAMERIDDGEDVEIPELSASYLPNDPGEATQLINVLCDHTKRKRDEGHYRLGYRLARRAELISRRAGLYDQEVGCSARFWVAHMLNNLGDPRAADVLKVLLPTRELLLGAEHPEVLATRSLEARVLNSIGKHRQALEKLEALLPIMEQVQGVRHHNVLSTLYLEARVLNSIGEHREALEKLAVLLPSHEIVKGTEHPDVLVTRSLEVDVLEGLGEHRQALEKLEALMPIYERVKGAEHPDVLVARHLEARILDSLDEHGKAFERLTALLPVMERVKGTRHPNVLATRILSDRIRSKIEPSESLDTPAEAGIAGVERETS